MTSADRTQRRTNFHSENFSWLVVSGYKAQSKGTGTINGAGNYDFTLTAYDGDIAGNGQTGVDRLRIVITDHATGQRGVRQPRRRLDGHGLGEPGGSIVIHKA